MESLRLFFDLNRDLVFFVYGLTFFVLGLAIALQSRHASRLEIARTLPWLAAFGFAHGFHEWGEYFIPIQASYLSAGVIAALQRLRLLLLAISFAFLFEFGLRLLGSSARPQRLHWMSSALLAAWIFVAFFVLPGRFPEPSEWQHLADALARYFIGLPGGLVAALGLRRHTYSRIRALDAPHILRNMRRVGVMMGLYALLGGLIVPPIRFFPGNLLNAEAFEALLVVPAPVFRSIIGLALAIFTIRALEVFDLEVARAIEGMEQQQILAAERDRIARDLHDGAIQKVYTAGLLVESAHHIAEGQTLVSERLEKAMGVLEDAIHDLRRNLVGLQSAPSSRGLRERLEELAQDEKIQAILDVDLEVEIPETAYLHPYRRDHILAILNEALSNVMRHANAERVTIRARQSDGWLHISVTDDGKGLPEAYEAGYGLRNMRDRARLLNGELTLEASPGERGTMVALKVPWSEEL